MKEEYPEKIYARTYTPSYNGRDVREWTEEYSGIDGSIEYTRSDLVPKWNLTNEILPDEGETVLIDDDPYTWYYVSEEESFYRVGSGECVDKDFVHQWMYRPKCLEEE